MVLEVYICLTTQLCEKVMCLFVILLKNILRPWLKYILFVEVIRGHKRSLEGQTLDLLLLLHSLDS